ncbi:ABC transporter substrate-binding protein [Aeromicrobium sp. Leaf350]|uniref:ABC transporter substrate-binding protein n=1 Tax=Aeromicrobium sp. Leaf350 TaxID=2876565 RepID=UPI001E461C6A|nr:ABC transporter substrate-binding protein [Aeromicrobium sp. Leaf350]
MTTIHPTRRRLVLLATAGVLVAGLLSACGGSDDEGPVEAVALPEAEGSTQYPLTLDTWLGESTLQERPERIAVFGYSSSLDALEAIGVTPVYYGGRDAKAGYEWNDSAYLDGIGVADEITDFVLDYESIAATEPDLIVVPGFLQDTEQFDKLSDIAPVLDLPEDPGNGDRTDWRALQRQIGEALDLSEAADEAVAEADAHIAEVAAAHPEWAGKTVTIGYDYGPEYGMSYYTVAGGPAEGLLLDLGFAANPTATSFVESDAISEENQGLLDADALVMIYNDEVGREARESQPLFQAVPAVADGRYESLIYPAGAATDPLITSDGGEAANAVWPLRRGASALSLPWTADALADGWLADIPFS